MNLLSLTVNLVYWQLLIFALWCMLAGFGIGLFFEVEKEETDEVLRQLDK